MGLIANDENLNKARQLLAHLEAGEEGEAQAVLDELTRLRENALFQELGRLTREFHDTLNSFQLDSDIVSLTEHDIPDAKERLNYVITMTEQAANRTLGAVEQSMPACDRLEAAAAKLHKDWKKFTKRELDVEQFRIFSKELDGFLASVQEDTTLLKGHLTDALMAQDFQDLTGQVIRKVITLVSDVEKNLVDLIRASGQAAAATGKGSGSRADKEALQGPPIPGKAAASTVSGQDEVDDLLSSLGF